MIRKFKIHHVMKEAECSVYIAVCHCSVTTMYLKKQQLFMEKGLVLSISFYNDIGKQTRKFSFLLE